MKYVAKIERGILLNSSFNVLKSWVNPRTPGTYKYLTEAQYTKLKQLGFQPVLLTEFIEVNKRSTSKKKSPVVVIWSDESNEECRTPFDSLQEATKWIDFKESSLESGEKFQLIKIENNSE